MYVVGNLQQRPQTVFQAQRTFVTWLLSHGDQTVSGLDHSCL